jgi:hypothetical protein
LIVAELIAGIAFTHSFTQCDQATLRLAHVSWESTLNPPPGVVNQKHPTISVGCTIQAGTVFNP